jgi:ABC-type taurine transport system ATPase subunit
LIEDPGENRSDSHGTIGHSETAHQLFKRMRLDPIRTRLRAIDHEIPTGIKPGSIVQLFGPASCGKSEILLHIIASVILPTNWQNQQDSQVYSIGGDGNGAIVYDNDLRFDLLRLIRLMEAFIDKNLQKVRKFHS